MESLNKASVNRMGLPQQQRKKVLLQKALDYVCENGLAQLSLRPLAAALETSDRMLVYHFKTRDLLISALLQLANSQMQEMFQSAFSTDSVTSQQVLASVRSLAQSPSAQPLLKLFVQIVGLSAQGKDPYLSSSRYLFANWHAWLSKKLSVPDEQRQIIASALLVIIDGFLVQTIIGNTAHANASLQWIEQLLPNS